MNRNLVAAAAGLAALVLAGCSSSPTEPVAAKKASPDGPASTLSCLPSADPSAGSCVAMTWC